MSGPMQGIGSTGGTLGSAQGAPRATRPGSAPFEQVLQREIGASRNIRFSRHALQRLESRGIQLAPADLDRLGGALDMAAAKGAKDSLVISGSQAFVVNVPTRTVVTALYGEQTKGSVFTNIDSAVVL